MPLAPDRAKGGRPAVGTSFSPSTSSNAPSRGCRWRRRLPRRCNASPMTPATNPAARERAAAPGPASGDRARPGSVGPARAQGRDALNLFHVGLDRFSVDIDLNYVRALDRAAMEAERPDVDAALDRLLSILRIQRYPRARRACGRQVLPRSASGLSGNARVRGLSDRELVYCRTCYREPCPSTAGSYSRILVTV